MKRHGLIVLLLILGLAVWFCVPNGAPTAPRPPGRIGVRRVPLENVIVAEIVAGCWSFLSAGGLPDHAALYPRGSIATRGAFLNSNRPARRNDALGILPHPPANRDTGPRRLAQGEP